MQDFSNQSFVYSGQKYTLSFTMYVNSAKHFSTHSLNNEDVQMFEYTNAFNQLYLKGTLTYTDRYGIVDKYLEKQYPYLKVLFSETEKEIENDITTEKLSPTNKLQHDFFITNVEILNRQGSIISYRMHLVSVNWFKLIGNITYSNYSKRPETVIDLIKTAFALNNLNVGKETFDKVKTEVKLNYVTNGNDNTLTMIKYLLSKLYYYDIKDPALKFIYYNDIKDQFDLFDILNKETSNATYSMIISMFKTQNETYLQEEPLNLATITKFPKTKTFQNIFNYEITDYDFQHNLFLDKSIASEAVIDYQNKRFADDNFEDKFEKIFDTTQIFKQRGTYWNNDNFIDIYQNAIQILNEDNSLVVNSSGVINRKPGDFININVDRCLKYVENEQVESLDDVKNKYKAYEGLWIASKVHHMVFPMIGKYRQNLVLFRNFITADTNSNAK